MNVVRIAVVLLSVALCSCGGTATSGTTAGASQPTARASSVSSAATSATTPISSTTGATTASSVAAPTTSTPRSTTGAVTTSTAVSTTPSVASSSSTTATTSSAVAATPGAKAAAAGGTCDSPYFPVKQGATWVYRYTAGPPLPDETRTITSVTPDSFVVHTVRQGKGADVTATCSANGVAIVELTSLTGQPGQTTTKVTNVQGVSVPRAAVWAPGNSWSASYDVSIQLGAGAVARNAVATVKVTDTVADQESVQVIAGRYQAYKVNQTTHEALTLGQGTPAGAPAAIDVPSTAWYAANVGMVKQTVNVASTAVTLELVSYTP